jgi:hypothetical protein
MTTEEIKEICYQIGSESSVHGLSKIAKKSTANNKLVWAVFVTAGVVFCFYFSSMSLGDFLKREVITKFQIIHEIPTKFPQIAVCNYNRYTTNFSADFIHATADLINTASSIKNGNNTDNELIQLFLAANLTEHDRKKLSYSMEDMLISCQYASQQCSHANFTWFYDLINGNCFIFNSDKDSEGPKFTENPGYMYGLSLELFVGVPDYLDDLAEVDSNGAIVFVSNRSTQSPFEFESNLVSTSMLTNFRMRRMFVTKLNTIFSPCVDNTGDNAKYSRNGCINLCIFRQLMELCQCLPPLYKPEKGRPRDCTSMNDFVCLAYHYVDDANGE